MSSTRHAVMRGPSFTGFGKRPSFIPAHHVDLLTGMGPFGAMIAGSRTRPMEGSSKLFGKMSPHVVYHEAGLRNPIPFLAEFGFGIAEFGSGSIRSVYFL
jgi:hypothetical protein